MVKLNAYENYEPHHKSATILISVLISFERRHIMRHQMKLDQYHSIFKYLIENMILISK